MTQIVTQYHPQRYENKTQVPKVCHFFYILLLFVVIRYLFKPLQSLDFWITDNN